MRLPVAAEHEVAPVEAGAALPPVVQRVEGFSGGGGPGPAAAEGVQGAEAGELRDSRTSAAIRLGASADEKCAKTGSEIGAEPIGAKCPVSGEPRTSKDWRGSRSPR